MNAHITGERLYLLADGALSSAEADAIREHLGTCPHCAASYEAVVRFDRVLRALPLDSPRSSFTNDLLAQLRIAPRSSRVIGLLGFLAPAFSVLVVGTLALLLLGVSEPIQAAGTGPHAMGVLTDAMRTMENSVGTASGWVTRVFGSIPGQDTLGILLALAGLLPALGLVDFLLGRRNVTR